MLCVNNISLSVRAFCVTVPEARICSIFSIIWGKDYAQEAPRLISRARSAIKEASEGISLRPLTRSAT